MLNEEQLDILSDAIKPMFQHLEHEVIIDIARRIKKTMTYTRTAELMAMDMQKLGYSPAKIRAEALKILNADAEFKRIVESNTIEYKKAVQEMIEEIVKDASEIGNEIISNAGNMSWIDDMRVWESSGQRLTDDSYLSTLQKAIAEQTIGEMINLTKTTGFKTMSGYEPMMNAFRIELDKAMIKLCTGTFSQEKVLNDVIHNLSQSGLRSIDYASGRSMQIDTAVKQALRTGCNQMSGKIMDENIIRSGQNLVYVSGHWGARNEGVGVANHEQWQSKVYYISDKKDYSEEARRIGQEAIGDIWISTGYSPDGSHENNPLGLHGYNCRHSHRVWFEGVSVLPNEQPEPEPVNINGKEYDYYAMTKKMRLMERGIRALKREMDANSKLGIDAKEISVKIKQKTREYKEFCRKCNVPERTSNLRVDSSATDITKTKAYEKYRNSITDNKKSSMISSSTTDNKGGIQMIEQIEKRNTSKGKAPAILHFDTDLNNRQMILDEKLQKYDDKCVVSKKSVGLSDLASLTAKNNVEYAMFTKGNQRLIIRGEEGYVNVTVEYAKELKSQGYKWSGHTHPGNDDFVLMPSDGDYEILEAFGQEYSSIYNSAGIYYIFGKE